MPLDDLVDQLRALNFDLARFSSAEQEASIEAAAREIERLRAREAEAAGRIDRLNVEVVKMIDKLEALLRLERPTSPVPCGWARRFIRWTKGRPR
jgi:cell division protein FtsB